MSYLEKAVATAVLLGVAYAAGSVVMERQDPKHGADVRLTDYFTNEQRQILLNERREIVGVWGKVATTRMVFLEGKEKAYCSDSKEGPTISEPSYCIANDTVNIDAGTVNYLSDAYVRPGDKETKAALLKFVVAHEFAHAWQKDEGITKITKPTDPIGTGLVKTRGYELQADCLAGQVLAITDPASVDNIKNILQQFPSTHEDPHHGSGDMRAENFMRGVRGESECKFVDDLLAYPDLNPSTQN